MSVWAVRALGAALAHAGVDLAAALAEVGIDGSELAAPDARIDMARAHALFERAPGWSGDPHFGLRAPSHVPRGAARALEYAIRSSTTAGDALAQLARYYAVINDRAGLVIEGGDPFVVR